MQLCYENRLSIGFSQAFEKFTSTYLILFYFINCHYSFINSFHILFFLFIHQFSQIKICLWHRKERNDIDFHVILFQPNILLVFHHLLLFFVPFIKTLETSKGIKMTNTNREYTFSIVKLSFSSKKTKQKTQLFHYNI